MIYIISGMPPHKLVCVPALFLLLFDCFCCCFVCCCSCCVIIINIAGCVLLYLTVNSPYQVQTLQSHSFRSSPSHFTIGSIFCKGRSCYNLIMNSGPFFAGGAVTSLLHPPSAFPLRHFLLSTRYSYLYVCRFGGPNLF
jgi:hypothetical protein